MLFNFYLVFKKKKKKYLTSILFHSLEVLFNINVIELQVLGYRNLQSNLQLLNAKLPIVIYTHTQN